MSDPSFFERAAGIVASTVQGVLGPQRLDGWFNEITGLGTSRDKSKAVRFAPGIMLDDAKLSELYTFEDLCATIVDTVADEEMREGFGLSGLASDSASDVKHYLMPFNIPAEFSDARRWGRLYGGAALWPLADDGLPLEEPLDETRIKTILGLRVIDRRWLWPETYYTAADGAPAKIGLPRIYRLSEPRAGGVGATIALIHESRLITFPGERTEWLTKIQHRFWDNSVLVKPFEALRNAGATWQAIEALTQDAHQGVFKIKGLWNKIISDAKQGQDTQSSLLSTGPSGLLLTRIRLLDYMRSVARSIAIDKDDEEFERHTTSFAGLPDLSDRAWLRVSAAAHMPVMLLTGEDPKGLGATGSAQLQLWFARTAASQRQICEPRLLRLLRILLSASDAPAIKAEDEAQAKAKGKQPAAPRADKVKQPPALPPRKDDYSQLGITGAGNSPALAGNLATDPALSENPNIGKSEPKDDKPIDKLGIVWLPLWAPTAKELAEIRLARAQEASALITSEVMLPEEAALALPADWWNLKREEREALLESQRQELLAARTEPIVNPPEPPAQLGPDGKPVPPKPGAAAPPKPGVPPAATSKPGAK